MFQTFSNFPITSRLPLELSRLGEIAYNLWWSWTPEAIDLFRRVSPDLWETTQHNPVLMLGTVGQKRLQELANDRGFIVSLESVSKKSDEYIHDSQMGYQRTPGETCIAFFAAEFGVARCLPLYAGGLGLLAGDHLKSASELGLPLVGVGLLYQQGYFSQYLSRSGHQGEVYLSNDFHNLPIQPQRTEDGSTLTITVPCSNHHISVEIWHAQIGRVPLFLLNTNLPANSVRDRDITNRLYITDMDIRLRQEMVLGIGGMRALNAMGITPTVCHLSEGHAAFAAVERIRLLMSRHGLSFTQARKIVSASTLFTTHTPVPAGTDKFSAHQIHRFLHAYYSSFELSHKDFMALGRQNPMDNGEPFTMPILALHLADRANGVSKLHGEVSRRLWQNVWSHLSEKEVPITSLTNGVYLPSWVFHNNIDILFNQYLGENWPENLENPKVWQKINDIPGTELWPAHERDRESLIVMVRQRLRAQLLQQNTPQREIKLVDSVLDPKALTIVFARRFTEYKRPTLILHSAERLVRLLTNLDRPVQIIFAGKSHPDDNIGKGMIHKIIQFIRNHRLRHQMVFIEDYDIAISRYLVQGSDIWLNTPRRPLEACGTSGMKAAANGVLNLSVLDGWWAEAYEPAIGWAIGNDQEYEDPHLQDTVDSQSLYDLLENEIIPLFYARDEEGFPQEWIRRMKNSMQKICPEYNSTRMVSEYNERFYIPATEQYRNFITDTR